MRLFVARHNYAGDSIPDDPKAERERPLKPEGLKIAKAMAAALVELGEVPDVIFCSPYARAQQTADIYGGAFNTRVSVIGDLAPDRPLEDRILELMGHKEIKRVALVGHHDNSTPAFDHFGGDMTDSCSRDDDDDVRSKLYDGKDWVPLVMGEVRRLKIDRKTGQWKCKFRLRPSDIGLKDFLK